MEIETKSAETEWPRRQTIHGTKMSRLEGERERERWIRTKPSHILHTPLLSLATAPISAISHQVNLLSDFIMHPFVHIYVQNVYPTWLGFISMIDWFMVDGHISLVILLLKFSIVGSVFVSHNKYSLTLLVRTKEICMTDRIYNSSHGMERRPNDGCGSKR